MKICPFRMTLSGSSGSVDPERDGCLKQLCAWYVTRNGEGNCSILVISEALKLYLKEERERRDAYAKGRTASGRA